MGRPIIEEEFVVLIQSSCSEIIDNFTDKPSLHWTALKHGERTIYSWLCTLTSEQIEELETKTDPTTTCLCVITNMYQDS
jgi:hypothetical protein